MVSSVSELVQLWERILSRIRDRLKDQRIFDSFFADSYIHRIDGDSMLVVASTELAANLLTSRYISMISEVVSEVTQSNFKITFVQKSDIPSTKIEKVQEKPTFFANSFINPKFTFDNFVVGASNLEAKQAALMIASNPGTMFNPLFLYSASGLGKTHLLHAMGNYIKEHLPASKVLYITTDDFVDEFIKYVHGDKDSESLKDFFKGIDFLLVDDIQFLADKPKTEEMFFHIFNALVNTNKQIVLTSDRHPTELKGLESRLVSRFSSGLAINIAKPDLETRKDILLSKIEANGLEVERFDEEVITFFAERFGDNIRELEGALNRLLFYIINIKKTDYVSLPIALESVQSLVSVNDTKSKLDAVRIINVVGDYYNITPAQITGRMRKAEVALARHIAMYLTRNLLDLPFKQIGQVFGGKDHSTVINACDKVEEQLKTSPDLAQAIVQLEKQLKV